MKKEGGRRKEEGGGRKKEEVTGSLPLFFQLDDSNKRTPK